MDCTGEWRVWRMSRYQCTVRITGLEHFVEWLVMNCKITSFASENQSSGLIISSPLRSWRATCYFLGMLVFLWRRGTGLGTAGPGTWCSRSCSSGWPSGRPRWPGTRSRGWSLRSGWGGAECWGLRWAGAGCCRGGSGPGSAGPSAPCRQTCK